MAIDLNACKVPADRKIKVTPILGTINIGKPSKTSFFRVKDGEGFDPEEFFVFEGDRGGGGSELKPYLVMPECQSFLNDLQVLMPAKFYFIQLYNSRIYKLDYVSQKLTSTGNRNEYNLTKETAYELAKTKWVRLYSNQDGGFYSYAYAEDNLPEPDWKGSPATLVKAIEIAFGTRILDTMEHPIIKELRGKL